MLSLSLMNLALSMSSTESPRKLPRAQVWQVSSTRMMKTLTFFFKIAVISSMHGPDFHYAYESITIANLALFSFPNHFCCQFAVRAISPHCVLIPWIRSALPIAHMCAMSYSLCSARIKNCPHQK